MHLGVGVDHATTKLLFYTKINFIFSNYLGGDPGPMGTTPLTGSGAITLR